MDLSAPMPVAHANAALRAAVKAGDEPSAKAALSAGADANYQPAGEAGCSLAFAAYNGHRELCALLLAAGADAGGDEESVVNAALAGGFVSLAEWLRTSIASLRTKVSKVKANSERRLHVEQVANRKVKNSLVRQERERRHRGERMAQAMAGVVEHQLMLDESLAEAAARRDAKAERLELAIRRRQEMAEAQEERYRAMAERTAVRHEAERRVEVLRQQQVVASRRRTYEEEEARKASSLAAATEPVGGAHDDALPWARGRPRPGPSHAPSKASELPPVGAPTAARVSADGVATEHAHDVAHEARRGERRRGGPHPRSHAAAAAVPSGRSPSSSRPPSLLARISSKGEQQQGLLNQLRRVQSEHSLTEHRLHLPAEARATSLLEERARREEPTEGRRQHPLARASLSLPAIHGDRDGAPAESAGRAAARAAREGDEEGLSHWLAHDEWAVLHGVDSNGRSALHIACAAGQAGCARRLLSAGASAEVKDGRRRTPMHEAVKAGSKLAVQLLLERGGRVDALDAEGRTPLTLALRRKRGQGDAEMIALLEG